MHKHVIDALLGTASGAGGPCDSIGVPAQIPRGSALRSGLLVETKL
jgi:hypothetical protein